MVTNSDAQISKEVRSVCVYCGSRAGNRPSYGKAAELMGTEIARRGLRLVYGSGSIGLMGIIANAARDGGAHVLGIIPHALEGVEMSGKAVGEVKIVGSMHERKAEMSNASDAFVAMPGGFGTLEELVETVTWAQLGIHSKPVGLLNVDGYYDHFLLFLDRAVEDGFLDPSSRQILITESDPGALLDKILAFDPSKQQGLLAKDRWSNSLPRVEG